MILGFSDSVIGAKHIVKGLPCQDSASYVIEQDYSAIVVADGHGSHKHFRSHIGSRLAVEAALETIKVYYSDPKALAENLPRYHKLILRKMEKHIIAVWNDKINAHFEANPVTDEEKKAFTEEEFEKISVASYYGTTLLVLVRSEGYLFGLQIGDGSMVAVFENGDVKMLLDYEESNPANITASMCNSNAASAFSDIYIETDSVAAIYTSTDGLYTSFGSDDDFLNYHILLTANFAKSDNFSESVLKNMKKRSNYGTQDDISLSCVYDVSRISACLDKLESKKT